MRDATKAARLNEAAREAVIAEYEKIIKSRGRNEDDSQLQYWKSTGVAGTGGPIEPDQLGEDEYHPMDPAGSSPLVAWLASDEAQYVSGQVIRAIHDKIYLMGGWQEIATVSSGEKRWDATLLGQLMATDIFRTRAPGLR